MFMFCSNCGSQLSDTAKFCTNCGAAVAPPQEPVYTPPAAPAFTPPEQPLYVPDGRVFTPPQQTAEPVYTAPEQPMYAPEPIFTAPQQPMYAPEPAYIPQPQPVSAPPKKKGKGILVAVIAAVLALVIIGGILIAGQTGNDQKTFDQAVSLFQEGEYAAALKLFEQLDDESSQAYADRCRWLLQNATAPTIAPTEAPMEIEPVATEPASVNTWDVDLTVTEAQLEYELTDEDVENFYALLEAGEEMAMTSNDTEAVEAHFELVDEAFALMQTQHSIAMVQYYCDLKDEATSELYLACTDTLTTANDAYLQAVRRIYLAETPHNEVLFADWTEEELAMLVRYTDEVAKLEKRNAEIEVAYQDMQDSDTMYHDMVPLYIEMVQNQNRIAQIYGYDNYYTYAYDQVYGRDYEGEEIELMRTYVSNYLSEAMRDAMNQFNTGLNALSYTDRLKLSGLLMEDYAGSQGRLKNYLASLPESTCNTMVNMFKGNVLFRGEGSGAMEGAFTTSIAEDRSICFFGPNYSDVLTIVHELGHYYGSMYGNLDDIPLDLAETQSQGNEWLFIGYLLTSSDSDMHRVARDYKLYNDLATIVICVIVDEFEERVYTHENVANLTSDDLDAIMADVCQRYGGTNYLKSVATDIQNYWRLVVVEQPVYYISYAVSAISAMNIYTISQEDYSTAVEVYCGLIENVDTEGGFLSNIKDAGLDGPFDEDVYIAIAEMFN